MDTSETYIKMCDCPEIRGDTMWPEWVDSKTAEAEWVYNKQKKELHLFSYYQKWGYSPDELIWLPRQDQIQKMFKIINKFWENIPPFLFIERLFFWNKIHKIQGEKTSLEQLWLAFYMHEEYGKAWDGEKWMIKKGEKK